MCGNTISRKAVAFFSTVCSAFLVVPIGRYGVPEFRKSLTAIAVTAGSVSAVLGMSSAAQAASPSATAVSAVAPLPAPGLPVVSNGPFYALNPGAGITPIGGDERIFSSSLPANMAWSPDGSRFASVEAFSAAVLRVRNPDDDSIVSAGSVTDFAKPGSPLANINGITWFNHGSEVVLNQNGSLVSVRVDGSQPRNPDGSYIPTPMLPGQTGITAVTANAAGTLLAFTQNTPGGGSTITIYDTTKPAGAALSTLPGADHATQPTLSPDGRYVAYVQDAAPGQNVASQIWLYDLQSPASSSNPRQVTSDSAVTVANPRFSPDGTRIAFAASASGMTSLKSFSVADPSALKIEVPTLNTQWFFWRPITHKPVERLAGGDRVGTAIATSQAAWETFGDAGTGRRTAKSVTLSRSDLFADALGGAGFAAHQQGPLLLTDPKHMDPATLKELQRVLGPGSGANGPTVYLLGGDSALSPDVQKALATANYHVVRIGGGNRFDTAVKIAQQDSGTKPSKVLVATGINYPDALAAGAAAGANANAVVVLTNDKTMPPETAAYLNSISGAAVYGVGGQAVAALGARQQIPLKGADRVATSMLVARTLFDTPGSVGFATSMNWPDSLAGGALQGTVAGPLILVDPAHGLTADEQQWLKQAATAIDSVQIYGGPAAVPAIETQVGTDIGGAGGFVVR